MACDVTCRIACDMACDIWIACDSMWCVIECDLWNIMWHGMWHVDSMWQHVMCDRMRFVEYHVTWHVTWIACDSMWCVIACDSMWHGIWCMAYIGLLHSMWRVEKHVTLHVMIAIFIPSHLNLPTTRTAMVRLTRATKFAALQVKFPVSSTCASATLR